MPATASAPGAYGLRLSGLPLGLSIQPDAPADWPSVRLEGGPDASAAHPEPLGPERCVIDLLEDRRLELVREPATARFLGSPLPPGDLAHPYLGPVATVFARWHGREAFHAGAFVGAGGGAVAVLGGKEAGKSTLMAALAAAGTPVIADDMLVVEHGAVFRGPRTIDLRAEPRTELRGPLAVSQARGGTRWRLALPPIEAATPLGGWVFLAAGPQWAVRRVPVAERLQRLARWRAWRHMPSDPRAMLDLAALPAWEFTRPLDWATLPAALETIQGFVAP